MSQLAPENRGIKPEKMPVDVAFENLAALARAVQADAKAHELIKESLEVVSKALGLS